MRLPARQRALLENLGIVVAAPSAAVDLARAPEPEALAEQLGAALAARLEAPELPLVAHRAPLASALPHALARLAPEARAAARALTGRERPYEAVLGLGRLLDAELLAALPDHDAAETALERLDALLDGPLGALLAAAELLARIGARADRLGALARERLAEAAARELERARAAAPTLRGPAAQAALDRLAPELADRLFVLADRAAGLAHALGRVAAQDSGTFAAIAAAAREAPGPVCPLVLSSLLQGAADAQGPHLHELAGELRAATRDPDPEIRREAVLALRALGPGAAAAELAEACVDPEPEVRAAAWLVCADGLPEACIQHVKPALLGGELDAIAAALALRAHGGAAEWVDLLAPAEGADALGRRDHAQIVLALEWPRPDLAWALLTAHAEVIGAELADPPAFDERLSAAGMLAAALRAGPVSVAADWLDRILAAGPLPAHEALAGALGDVLSDSDGVPPELESRAPRLAAALEQADDAHVSALAVVAARLCPPALVETVAARRLQPAAMLAVWSELEELSPAAIARAVEALSGGTKGPDSAGFTGADAGEALVACACLARATRPEAVQVADLLAAQVEHPLLGLAAWEALAQLVRAGELD